MTHDPLPSSAANLENGGDDFKVASAAEKCPDCRVCALCNHAHDLLDCEDNEVPCAECPKGVCVDVYWSN